MELGDGGIKWFWYVPQWKGNRDLEGKEQLALEVRRMTTSGMLSEEDEEAALFAWAKENAPDADKHPELARDMASFDADTILSMKRFVENTKNFQNFVFNDVEVSDPVLIFLAVPFSRDESTEQGLVAEINDTIYESTGLFGEKLKNYAPRFAGCELETTSPPSATSGSSSASSASSDTLPESETGRRAASIKPEPAAVSN